MERLKLTLKEAITLAQEDINGFTYFGKPKKLHLEIKGGENPTCQHCGHGRASLYLGRFHFPIIECVGCKASIGRVAHQDKYESSEDIEDVQE